MCGTLNSPGVSRSSVQYSICMASEIPDPVHIFKNYVLVLCGLQASSSSVAPGFSVFLPARVSLWSSCPLLTSAGEGRVCMTGQVHSQS